MKNKKTIIISLFFILLVSTVSGSYIFDGAENGISGWETSSESNNYQGSRDSIVKYGNYSVTHERPDSQYINENISWTKYERNTPRKFVFYEGAFKHRNGEKDGARILEIRDSSNETLFKMDLSASCNQEPAKAIRIQYGKGNCKDSSNFDKNKFYIVNLSNIDYSTKELDYKVWREDSFGNNRQLIFSGTTDFYNYDFTAFKYIYVGQRTENSSLVQYDEPDQNNLEYYSFSDNVSIDKTYDDSTVYRGDVFKNISTFEYNHSNTDYDEIAVRFEHELDSGNDVSINSRQSVNISNMSKYERKVIDIDYNPADWKNKEWDYIKDHRLNLTVKYTLADYDNNNFRTIRTDSIELEAEKEATGIFAVFEGALERFYNIFLKPVVDLFQGIFNFIADKLVEIGEYILDIFDFLLDLIWDGLVFVFEVFLFVFTLIMNVITGILSLIITGIINTFQYAFLYHTDVGWEYNNTTTSNLSDSKASYRNVLEDDIEARSLENQSEYIDFSYDYSNARSLLGWNKELVLYTYSYQSSILSDNEDEFNQSDNSSEQKTSKGYDLVNEKTSINQDFYSHGYNNFKYEFSDEDNGIELKNNCDNNLDNKYCVETNSSQYGYSGNAVVYNRIFEIRDNTTFSISGTSNGNFYHGAGLMNLNDPDNKSYLDDKTIYNTDSGKSNYDYNFYDPRYTIKLNKVNSSRYFKITVKHESENIERTSNLEYLPEKGNYTVFAQVYDKDDPNYMRIESVNWSGTEKETVSSSDLKLSAFRPKKFQNIGIPVLGITLINIIFLISGIIMLFIPEPIKEIAILFISTLANITSFIFKVITSVASFISWATSDGLNKLIKLSSYALLFKAGHYLKIAFEDDNGITHAIDMVVNDVFRVFNASMRVIDLSYNLASSLFATIIHIVNTIRGFIRGI